VNPIVVKDDQGHLLALGLPIVGGDQQWSAHTSYNPVTVSASKDITEAGVAPPVVLRATHEETLAVVPLSALKEHALDAA